MARRQKSSKCSHLVELRCRRCRRCAHGFVICRSCDRGHIYCSQECAQRSCAESKKRSRQTYRRSPHGREVRRKGAERRRRRQGRSPPLPPAESLPQRSLMDEASPPVVSPSKTLVPDSTQRVLPVHPSRSFSVGHDGSAGQTSLTPSLSEVQHAQTTTSPTSPPSTRREDVAHPFGDASPSASRGAPVRPAAHRDVVPVAGGLHLRCIVCGRRGSLAH